MSIRNNNHVVCDLNKVQWCEHWYVNQYGDSFRKMPKAPSVRGTTVKDEVHMNGKETMMEFAIKHKLLDTWTAVCKVTMTANKSLTYTGKKAESIWKAWQAKMFKKEKKG